jgi:hypothetical protein
LYNRYSTQSILRENYDAERIVVRLEVKDTGWGISSQESTKLFCELIFIVRNSTDWV